MFNSIDVLNRDIPVRFSPKDTHVGDTQKYEGKDNPGVPWYYRRQGKKGNDKKKEPSKNEHQVDLIA